MNRQGRRRKAEGGIFSRRSRYAHISFRLPPSAFRLGTTLVELLITITIIAILSLAFLGVSNLAMENGRKARTKSTIAKIHGLLMEKWNSYATRRVDIDPTVLDNLEAEIKANVAPAFQRRALGEARADLRLLAVRELMRLEMPDRWSDIVLNGLPDANPKAVVVNNPLILAEYPAISRAYQRRLGGLKDTIDGNALTGDVARDFQGAECLFMIIMLTTGDGEARSLFSEQDIGDVDGDGAPEFLDGWGRTISFIRWPAGFAVSGQSSLMSADADGDHDSNDPFRRDLPQASPIPINAYPASVQPRIQVMRARNSLAAPISGFRLVPLIYSAGPDGDTDLVTSTKALVFDPYLDYTLSNPGTQTNQPSLGGLAVSDNDGDNWLDNIHNHLQDNK